jgi:hypothetical protein
MTKALLSVVNQNPDLTYVDLQKELRKWLWEKRYYQTPQVSGNPEFMKRKVFE